MLYKIEMKAELPHAAAPTLSNELPLPKKITECAKEESSK